MKYLLAIGLCVWLTVSVAAQGAQQLLDRVKEKLEKVASYEAAGKMIIDVPYIKAPASAVTVYFKKPDKLKIVKDNGISILPRGGVSMNLNSILSGGKYAVVDGGTSSGSDGELHVVKLLPLDEGENIVLSTLYIDPAHSVIRKALVTTKDNGSYEMDLSYGKYISWGLPEVVNFVFDTKGYKLPKGITFDYEKGGTPKQPPNSGKGKITITYADYQINKNIPDAVFSK